MTAPTTTDRPWDYSVRGRVTLNDAEVEALADRLTPSRVGVTYDSKTEELFLTGYTTGDEPWAALGWLLSTVSTLLGGNRLAMCEAIVKEGASDEEVVDFLKEVGLYQGPEGHGYEGDPR
jgi:hypothetical protein